jgi:tetrahydromethanopterin S-methyltransferase subunit B
MYPQQDNPTVTTHAPDVVRWAAVIAGVVIGLGIFAMLNALWWALEYSASDGWVSDNLAWLLGGSAAVSLLLAGLIAGAIAEVRGAWAGLLNGATAWGLLFLLSLTAIIPGAMNLTSKLRSGVEQGATTFGGYPGAGGNFTVASTLWTTFWSLLVGLVLAMIGGILGGRLRRPIILAGQHVRRVNTPVEMRETRQAGDSHQQTPSR